MQGLWAVRSGRFIGWKNGDILYDVDGNNIGFFDGNIAYSLNCNYIGEIFRDDWIGKREGVIYPSKGSRIGYVGIALVKYVDRVGMAIAGWEDPDF